MRGTGAASKSRSRSRGRKPLDARTEKLRDELDRVEQENREYAREREGFRNELQKMQSVMRKNDDSVNEIKQELAHKDR